MKLGFILRRRRRASKRGGGLVRSRGNRGSLFETLENRVLLTFAPPVDYPVGNWARDIVAGDFNGDGALDLVTANGFIDDNNLTFLEGKGDGAFQSPAPFSSGSIDASVALAVGDFNRDGKLDLVESNGFQLGVFLGNGDGTFEPPLFVNAGSPGKFEVGDFNGDGKLDLAVTDGAQLDVNVLLGNGDGTFGAPASYALSKLPGAEVHPGQTDGTFAIAVADVNHDGKLDIAAASNNVRQVSVLLGRGDGTFAPSLDYAVDQTAKNAPSDGNLFGPVAIALGDLNGDGRADLIVANQDSGTVSVLIGNGDGAFRTAVDFKTVGIPDDVIVGDFNNDGQPDIVASSVGAHELSVLYGRGDGTFQYHVDFAAPSPTAVVEGDFNRDGMLDLATANLHDNSVSVLLDAPTPNERFIIEVYRQLLGRQVDAGAAAYWKSFLDNGGSREQMTLNIEGSLEHRADEVRAVYRKYLQRDPDAGGWQYFTQQLGEGGTVEDVAAAIVGSSEYMQGVATPLVVAPGEPTNDGFVEKLFHDALGRDADQASLNALNSLLANHYTHRQVAEIVFHSSEYARNLVQDWYLEFLGRNPEPDALGYFSQALLHGQTDEQVISHLIGSAEFFTRLGEGQ